jgi:alkylation response protein AidB-like acyl-CoA dehydrogenase
VGGVISTDEMERWEAKALTAIAADLVGTMDGAIELSVGHAKLRSQFGVPIGSFQAIQHLIADQFVTYEGATWVVRHAAWCADELATTEALVAARTGKAYTSGRARGVAESTVQVLGGTGFLWESWAHVYLRRAILGSVALGNEDHQALEIAISRSKG